MLLCGRPATIVLAVVTVLGVVGCSAKAITKPRSVVVREAQSRGLPVAGIEVERARFYTHQQEQEQQLIELVRRRSSVAARDVNYRLGPGDEVEISVFEVPELDLTVQVRQSGLISLPLIGALPVVGLTEADLHQELTQRLRKFVRQPELSVYISRYGSQKVAVLGAVQKPGSFSLKKGANTVLELIGRAGGLTDLAGSYLNLIPAEISGLDGSGDVALRARLAWAGQDAQSSDRAIEVGLDRVLGTSGGLPIDIPVQPGDVVIIPEAGNITVDGEVFRTGSFSLGRRMTLLAALAAAGGINYSAKVDEIEMIRDLGEGDVVHLVLNLEDIAKGQVRDPLLKNGDIIRVPSDSGRRLSRDTFEGLSQIINFGIGGTVSMVP